MTEDAPGPGVCVGGVCSDIRYNSCLTCSMTEDAPGPGVGVGGV